MRRISIGLIACLLFVGGCALSARYDRKRVFLVTFGPTLFYSSDVEAEAKTTSKEASESDRQKILVCREADR